MMGPSGNTKSNTSDFDDVASDNQKTSDISALDQPLLDHNELALIENLFNARRYEELEKRISHHIKQTPSASFLLNILGLSQAGLGKYDKALLNYRKLLSFQPDHAGVHYNIGIACLNTGDFEGAITSFNRTKELDPDLGGIDKNLGVSHNNLRKYEEAIHYYEKALIENPADHELHRNIGIACDNLGRTEVAINHYLGALKNDPADIKTYNRLGSALISIDRPEDALRVLKQGITIAPKNYELHVNLGSACSNLDKIDAATRLLTRAIELEPEKPKAYVQLGTIMQGQGKYDEALFHFDQALELESTDPATHCLKGTTYLKSGLIQTSMDCFQRALELEPDHVDALYLLGICLNDEGLYEQAHQHFNHALSLSPDDASLHTQLGKNYIGKGLLDQAISCFNNALDITPERPEAIMGLAECYSKTGTPYTALEKYQLVLELQPDSIAALTEFAETVSRLNTTKITPTLRRHITSCFISNNICSNKVSDIASIIIKKDLNSFSTEKTTGIDLFEDLDRMTSGLLLPFLKNCPISDPDILQIITKVRAGILNLTSDPEIDLPSNKKIMSLLDALASQCFISAYRWPVTEDEQQRFSTLKDKVTRQLTEGAAPDKADLLVLACYEPLRQNSAVKDWALIAYENYQPSLKPFLKQQIIEQERELILAQSIPRLTDIEENLKSVPAEYWDGIPPYTPKKYTKHIHNLIAPYRPAVRGISECPQILIAGCKSGQTAITAAQAYRKSDIIAIDTSLRQLSCAKRKSDENGINNINFMQADISKLNNWDKKFEVIECFQHGELNELLLCLKPLLASGGYLKLSLPGCNDTYHTVSGIITTLKTHSLDFIGLEIDDPMVKQSYLQMFPDDPDCIKASNWNEFEMLNPSTFAEVYNVWSHSD